MAGRPGPLHRVDPAFFHISLDNFPGKNLREIRSFWCMVITLMNMETKHPPDWTAYWEVAARADPTFRSRVWERLENRRLARTDWKCWWQVHHKGILCCSAAWIALVVLSAGWLALQQNRMERDNLLEHYLSSIDAHRKISP